MKVSLSMLTEVELITDKKTCIPNNLYINLAQFCSVCKSCIWQRNIIKWNLNVYVFLIFVSVVSQMFHVLKFHIRFHLVLQYNSCHNRKWRLWEVKWHFFPHPRGYLWKAYVRALLTYTISNNVVFLNLLCVCQNPPTLCF